MQQQKTHTGGIRSGKLPFPPSIPRIASKNTQLLIQLSGDHNPSSCATPTKPPSQLLYVFGLVVKQWASMESHDLCYFPSFLLALSPPPLPPPQSQYLGIPEATILVRLGERSYIHIIPNPLKPGP